MHVYLENSFATFHPDRIQNNGTLGFFEKRSPQQKNKHKMRSVPDLKMWEYISQLNLYASLLETS